MATILESKDDYQKFILSDVERTLIYRVRVLLKDLPNDVFRSLNTLVEKNRGERWSDQMILNYLYQSLGTSNSVPLQTGYSLDDIPEAYIAPLCWGAVFFALFGEAVLQTAENFSYSDNGLSLNFSAASGFSGLASQMYSGWIDSITKLKLYIRPAPAGQYGGMLSGARIRSYSPRMWVYR